VHSCRRSRLACWCAASAAMAATSQPAATTARHMSGTGTWAAPALGRMPRNRSLLAMYMDRPQRQRLRQQIRPAVSCPTAPCLSFQRPQQQQRAHQEQMVSNQRQLPAALELGMERILQQCCHRQPPWVMAPASRQLQPLACKQQPRQGLQQLLQIRRQAQMQSMPAAHPTRRKCSRQQPATPQRQQTRAYCR
jgi:hypothetical protein